MSVLFCSLAMIFAGVEGEFLRSFGTKFYGRSLILPGALLGQHSAMATAMAIARICPGPLTGISIRPLSTMWPAGMIVVEGVGRLIPFFSH